MKYFKFLLSGVIFGIILTKGEIISWYRIYEMFRFESFHMYGVIGSAVVLGILGVQVIKYRKASDIEGKEIRIPAKARTWTRYILGGTIFGLGWALSGACPGPMFALIGYGYISLVIVLVAAVIGTFLYGIVKHRLPH